MSDLLSSFDVVFVVAIASNIDGGDRVIYGVVATVSLFLRVILSDKVSF
jgi:hypothetical protein